MDLISALKKIVGEEYVECSPARLISYSYDASFAFENKRHVPLAAVMPKDTAEVSAVLAFAAENKIPVVPRGAGTNLSGGTVPVAGGIVLVMTRMNRILDIDSANMTVTVQPGVITKDLQQAVENLGLFYPPDPASLNTCTIGGNLAECAGGPRGVKYGVTRDYVLGLEVVLADGSILKTGGKASKGVTGFDLTRLLVGSEGTLGVITEAVLKLIPKPQAHYTLLAIYDDVYLAAKSVNACLLQGVTPACIEFLDKTFIQCIENYAQIGLPLDSEAVVLIELDGASQQIEIEAEIVSKVCEEHQVRQLKKAADAKEREELWKARRAAFASIARLRPSILTEDIVVPRAKFADMVVEIQKIAAQYELMTAILGHAGDGNLHADILTDETDAEELLRVKKAVKAIIDKAIAFGGTVSGEHGIGLAKVEYMQQEVGDTGLKVMKAVKKAFDPLNILNPNKFI